MCRTAAINIEIGLECVFIAGEWRCKGGSVPPGHFLQMPSFRRFSLAGPASQSSPEYLCKNTYKPVRLHYQIQLGNPSAGEIEPSLRRVVEVVLQSVLYRSCTLHTTGTHPAAALGRGSYVSISDLLQHGRGPYSGQQAVE